MWNQVSGSFSRLLRLWTLSCHSSKCGSCPGSWRGFHYTCFSLGAQTLIFPIIDFPSPKLKKIQFSKSASHSCGTFLFYKKGWNNWCMATSTQIIVNRSHLAFKQKMPNMCWQKSSYTLPFLFNYKILLYLQDKIFTYNILYGDFVKYGFCIILHNRALFYVYNIIQSMSCFQISYSQWLRRFYYSNI